MSADTAIVTAREYFPRGLDQPENGYRFSVDSLLLAAFARGAGPRVLDLGCGCGVVGLAMLLDNPEISVTGLEADRELAACAGANAVKLGFGGGFKVLEGDVLEVRAARPFEPESFDVVVSNPPYREPGSGRTPDGQRFAARFEAAAGIEDFARAAAYGLKNKGRFMAVFLPERLNALLAALAGAGLEAKRLKFVHGKTTELAKIVLVEARKNAGPGLIVEPPLVIYAGGARTCGALDFCPRLECGNGCC